MVTPGELLRKIGFDWAGINATPHAVQITLSNTDNVLTVDTRATCQYDYPFDRYYTNFRFVLEEDGWRLVGRTV